MSSLIYQKISDIMNELNAVAKDRDNTIQKFKFRGIDDVMNELHPHLKKNRIFIMPEVLEQKREEHPTKSGGVMTFVILKIKYTFFAEDGSSVTATMIGEGADTGDKASNKAQSVALKYALLQVFAIPTEDDKDPDKESHEKQKKDGSKKPPALTAGEIREKRIDNMLNFFAKHDISTTDIGNKYGIGGRDELTNEDIDELASIANAISKGLKKKEDFFGQPQYEETF